MRQVVRRREMESGEHWHCPECRELVAPADKAKHRDLRHTDVVCEECGARVAADVLATHTQYECLHRKMECKYCHMKVLAKDHADHVVRGGLPCVCVTLCGVVNTTGWGCTAQEYCGGRTVTCDVCKRPIVLKQVEIHMAVIHHVNPSVASAFAARV